MNVLFVCSRNKWRSPTAEAIYKQSNRHQVRSAGTASSAHKKITSKDLGWAEIIFCMEKEHRTILLNKFRNECQNKKMVVLDIDDNYKFLDPELVEMIKALVDPYLYEHR